MENLNITIDKILLEEKSREFATKGALKAIEEYYTGYDSPYKKAISENLSKNTIDSYSFKLPDIIALVNEHLTIEIDKIANTAVAKTFIPLVAQLLTRQAKEANFSDILKKFIETAGYDSKEIDNFSVNIKKEAKWGWLSITIEDDKREYSFTLHEEHDSKKTGNLKYQLLSLPSCEKTDNRMMRLQLEGASLELPFTRDILRDNFVTYLAGYVISDTIITIDTDEFDNNMFPETCHCH
ncbi:MAG TPA: hypothetical protein VGN20_19220 [Mucilaginibacter sp.]|jgi:hypothetical protein